MLLTFPISDFDNNEHDYETLTCQYCREVLNSDILFAHTNLCPSMPRKDSSDRFVCFSCTYHTSRKSDMIRHIRKHTGEKPYKCSYCEYTCTQNSNLKMHMNVKHCNWTL